MTAGDGPLVRDYREADRDRVLDVLADALAGFPPIDTIVGTDAAARGRRRKLFEPDLRPGSHHHTIVAEAHDGLTGVLIYADAPDCFSTSLRSLLAFVRLAGPRIMAGIRVFRQIASVHPDGPHRHLTLMGVSTDRQGGGIGGSLMREYVRRCDEAGLDGYLETVRHADPSRPSHERFYGRYGFEVVDEVGASVEGTGVTMSRRVGADGHRVGDAG